MDSESLVREIQAEPDGPRRCQLEERYWALVAEQLAEGRPKWWRQAFGEYGETRAKWFREEYEWLRRQAELSTSVVST